MKGIKGIRQKIESEQQTEAGADDRNPFLIGASLCLSFFLAPFIPFIPARRC